MCKIISDWQQVKPEQFFSPHDALGQKNSVAVAVFHEFTLEHG